MRKQTTLAAIAASGCMALLVGCPKGGGSWSVKVPAVSTEAYVPGSVTARSTFMIPVALVPTAQMAGSAQTADARSVRILDVGTVSPRIDCGATRTLMVGGNPVDVSCRAPDTVPGGNNEHRLRIQVAGNSNPNATSSVHIVNAGVVDDVLEDAYGTRTDRAAPGDPLVVAFTSNSNPPGVGTYTVSAPAGWQVDGDGVCTLPSGQGSSCSVGVAVPGSATIGATAYIEVSPGDGSSRLMRSYLPVDIEPAGSLSAGVGPGLEFLYAENITATLYANLPSQTPTFTYKPAFTFQNKSGGTLDIASARVSGMSSPQYVCGSTSIQTPQCSLANGSTYVVSGTLNNDFKTLPAAPATISVAVKPANAATVQRSEAVTFVKYVPGHVAVRVINRDATKSVYAAAFYQSTMVKFDSGGDPAGIGTLAKTAGLDFKDDQYTLPSDDSVIYLPYGDGGKLYVARGSSFGNVQGAPSVTNAIPPPPYVVLETSYQNNGGNPCSGGNNTAPVCERLVFDLSYVNAIAVVGNMATMGSAKPYSLNTQDASFGAITTAPEQDVFNGIKKIFDNAGTPWQYVAANGTKNLVQAEKDGSVSKILAPIQVEFAAAYNPFPKDYYGTYIDALWNYLGNQPIYIDASGTADAEGNFKSDHCVLQGQVVPSTSTSPHAGKLVFSVTSGDCPTYGYVKSGLPNMHGIDSCGYTSADKPDTLPCRDTPNVVLERFNDCDFLQATGSGQCHPLVDPTGSNTSAQPIDAATFFDNGGLWGPNGTYRAVVGRAIASYQAIGLLPPCANPTEVMNSAHASQDVTNGLAFQNPSCLPSSFNLSYNLYADAVLRYVNVYTYSYGDFLGHDGTITFYEGAFPEALAADLPRAQPVTIDLH